MMRLLPAAALVVAALSAGCDSKARVRGRVVEGGQPVTFPPTQVALEITPIVGGAPQRENLFTAVVNEDGTFEVHASGGQLPPGEYLVVVKAYGKIAERFKNLGEIRKSFKAGQNEFTIDLANPNA